MPVTTNVNSILPKSKLTEINQGLAELLDIERRLEMAEQSGVQCDERRQALADIRKDYENWKRIYFASDR